MAPVLPSHRATNLGNPWRLGRHQRCSLLTMPSKWAFMEPTSALYSAADVSLTSTIPTSGWGITFEDLVPVEGEQFSRSTTGIPPSQRGRQPTSGTVVWDIVTRRLAPGTGAATGLRAGRGRSTTTKEGREGNSGRGWSWSSGIADRQCPHCGSDGGSGTSPRRFRHHTLQDVRRTPELVKSNRAGVSTCTRFFEHLTGLQRHTTSGHQREGEPYVRSYQRYGDDGRVAGRTTGLRRLSSPGGRWPVTRAASIRTVPTRSGSPSPKAKPPRPEPS